MPDLPDFGNLYNYRETFEHSARQIWVEYCSNQEALKYEYIGRTAQTITIISCFEPFRKVR